MKKRKSPKLDSIISKLRELTSDPSGNPIPTLQELSSQWRVSYHTVRKAVSRLSSEGLITCIQGKGISRIAPEGAPSEPEAGTSIHNLYTKIKQQILTGIIKTGNLLPKLDYYVITEHISRSTVTKAFKQLAASNLIHKKGSRWFAGPQPTDNRLLVRSRSSESPTVLIVSSNFAECQRVHTSGHLRSFMQAFEQELQNAGYQKRLVFTRAKMELEGAEPSIQNLRSEISRLGRRYAGTFIIAESKYLNTMFPEVKYLLLRKRPVIYFDHADLASDVNRRSVKDENRLLYRFYLDENTAIRLALTTLSQLKHKTVAAVHCTQRMFNWSERRIQSIKEINSQLHEPLSVFVAKQTIKPWDPREWQPKINESPIESQIRMLAPDGNVDEGGMRMPLTASAPINASADSAEALLEFLRINRATAIIAPNDRFAHQYHLWLSSLGISIPRDMSIISFDNKYEFLFFPITTIDFGFSQLGYQAAHIFIGDIPVKADADGNIAGECTLIDRGSLGKPRLRAAKH